MRSSRNQRAGERAGGGGAHRVEEELRGAGGKDDGQGRFEADEFAGHGFGVAGKAVAGGSFQKGEESGEGGVVPEVEAFGEDATDDGAVDGAVDEFVDGQRFASEEASQVVEAADVGQGGRDVAAGAGGAGTEGEESEDSHAVEPQLCLPRRATVGGDVAG